MKGRESVGACGGGGMRVWGGREVWRWESVKCGMGGERVRSMEVGRGVASAGNMCKVLR